VRRAVVLGAFAGLLVGFRHLAPLGIFFVAISRSLGALTKLLEARTRLGRRASVLVSIGALVAAMGGAVAIGVGRAIHAVITLRQALPEKIALVRETPLYQQIRDRLQDTDTYLDSAKTYATGAVHYLTSFGHLLLNAVIALILAAIFLLEHEELERWARSVEPHSFAGTLLRWFSHLADAVVITLQLQLIVAACNAALTLPILLVLGLPHPWSLSLLIFASSLVPVVGNLVSGAVLSAIAYHAHGWWGVAVLVVLTFALHKIESYYLNPRLTARHVRLPGFVLIVSLIAWEHLLGIPGLFVSFPFLFVLGRIAKEIRDEDLAPDPAPDPATSAG
jgi:predicted PurR-regulated permease PerM